MNIVQAIAKVPDRSREGIIAARRRELVSEPSERIVPTMTEIRFCLGGEHVVSTDEFDQLPEKFRPVYARHGDPLHRIWFAGSRGWFAVCRHDIGRCSAGQQNKSKCRQRRIQPERNARNHASIQR